MTAAAVWDNEAAVWNSEAAALNATPNMETQRRTAKDQQSYRDEIKADPAKYGAYKQKEKRAKRKYWRDDNRKRAERIATAAAVWVNEAAVWDDEAAALNATSKTETHPYLAPESWRVVLAERPDRTLKEEG